MDLRVEAVMFAAAEPMSPGKVQVSASSSEIQDESAKAEIPNPKQSEG
jgi:hypothetical protein